MSDTTIRPPEQLVPASPESAGSELARIVAEISAERSKPGWASFSLELNDDQRQLRDWVHEFAATVIRPAAHDWDEREETPWPIIQAAAETGLYGLESTVNFFIDPSGLLLPAGQRGVVLG